MYVRTSHMNINSIKSVPSLSMYVGDNKKSKEKDSMQSSTSAGANKSADSAIALPSFIRALLDWQQHVPLFSQLQHSLLATVIVSRLFFLGGANVAETEKQKRKVVVLVVITSSFASSNIFVHHSFSWLCSITFISFHFRWLKPGSWSLFLGRVQSAFI